LPGGSNPNVTPRATLGGTTPPPLPARNGPTVVPGPRGLPAPRATNQPRGGATGGGSGGNAPAGGGGTGGGGSAPPAGGGGGGGAPAPAPAPATRPGVLQVPILPLCVRTLINNC
jgi:hypothetical protein